LTDFRAVTQFSQSYEKDWSNTCFVNSVLRSRKLAELINLRDTTNLARYFQALGATPEMLATINFEAEVYITPGEDRLCDKQAFSQLVANSIDDHPGSGSMMGAHWIWKLARLDGEARIDLLLLIGTQPAFGDGLKLIAEAIRRVSTHPFDEDEMSSRELQRVKLVTDGRCGVFRGKGTRIDVTGDKEIQSILRRVYPSGLEWISLLCFAILKKQRVIVKYLVAAGYHYDYHDNHTIDPFECSILTSDFGMLELLADSCPRHLQPRGVDTSTLTDFARKFWLAVMADFPTRKVVKLIRGIDMQELRCTE
jgi:hypothetical protein